MDLGYRLVSLAGLFVMLGIAYALSENRRAISARVLVWGVSLQLILALFVLMTDAGRWLFEWAQRLFLILIDCSNAGASFVFGELVTEPSYGAMLAFQVLPIIIFFSAISTVLYHLGVIQLVVRALARVMLVSMRISGAESLAAALFIFMGIESVTAISKYIEKMTRSELFVVMTAFLATLASSVIAVYSLFGAEVRHLLAASIMSAPAAVVIAKMMIPETGKPLSAGRVEFEPDVPTHNVVDAAATGAASGLQLALNIGAMLMAFVGIVTLINLVMGALIGFTLNEAFGYLFAPFAIVMGVPLEDAFKVGQLLGTKTILNEFLAYQAMQDMVAAGELNPRSVLISTYALCGFANLGSIAILIGAVGSLIPDRRAEVASLSARAIVSGTLACFMTACFAGVLA